MSNTTSPAAVASLLFCKTGDPSAIADYTSWALDDELMRYAEENARKGEAVAAAVGRLCRDDDVAKALARASYAAEQCMQRTMSAGAQLVAFKKHLGVDEAALRKNAQPAEGSREHLADLLDEIAKREQRQGETFYDAYDRLMQTDDQFKKAYQRYNEAKG